MNMQGQITNTFLKSINIYQSLTKPPPQTTLKNDQIPAKMESREAKATPTEVLGTEFKKMTKKF